METNQQLAWHESLELHELTAFNSIGLMKLKHALPKLENKQLKTLYQRAITELETSINQLLQFYKSVPVAREEDRSSIKDTLHQGDLLLLTKTAVRNYSIAITETATPELKDVLVSQLMKLIKLHDAVYQYMYTNGNYPSYDINKLFQNDVQLAKKALKL